MVPGSGIEPLTNGLSIHCSTSELTWYWYAKLLMYFNMVSATSSQKPRRELLPCPYPWSKDQRFHGLLYRIGFGPIGGLMDGLRPLTLVLSRPCITGIGPGMTFIYYYNHNSSTFACCCQAFVKPFHKNCTRLAGYIWCRFLQL